MQQTKLSSNTCVSTLPLLSAVRVCLYAASVAACGSAFAQAEQSTVAQAEQPVLAQAEQAAEQHAEHHAAHHASGMQEAKDNVDEVLVTSRRIEQTLPLELAQYGNRVQLIDTAELEKRNIVDVAQALQVMAPSVYIQTRAGAFDYVEVSMQGSTTGDVLWLVDGVRITNRIYNRKTPIDTIPAAMIERIEVLEGGQGLFYGTQAVSGVINIVTKSFTKETNGRVSVGVDTDEGRHLSGYARGSAGPHEFVVYGSSDVADGYQPYPTEDYQPSATYRMRGYDVQTVGAKYALDLGEKVRLSAGYHNTKAPRLDAVVAATVAEYYNTRDEDIINVKLDWDVTNSLGLYIKAYEHKWDSLVYRLDNSLANPGTTTWSANGLYWGFKDAGVNALAKYVAGKGGFEYYLGYDFQRFNGRDDFLIIDDQTEKVHAFTFQMRTGDNLSQRLKLALGTRYNIPKDAEKIAVWNGSASYDLTDNLVLRGSVGTSYRLPDAEQLYAHDPCCTLGNRSLAAEQSRNLNLSIAGTTSIGDHDLRWELAGYARQVDDLIMGMDDGTGTLVYRNSNDQTEVKGWMASLTASLAAGLSANVSYSQTSAKFKGSNFQIDHVPEATAKFQLDYASDSLPIGATISTVYRGDTYQTLTGGIGRRSLGTALITDISGYFEFGADRRHRLTMAVQNVTDEVYYSQLRRERIDGTSISYAARNLGLPRLASLTYSLSF